MAWKAGVAMGLAAGLVQAGFAAARLGGPPGGLAERVTTTS